MRASLRLLVLAVADLPRSRTFYLQAFDWELAVDLPVYVQFRVPGGVGVSLYQREAFSAQVGTTPALCPTGACTSAELYLEVENLSAATDAILAAGARALSPAAARDWGDEAAYFADPDGHVIALFRALEQTDPGG